MFGQGLFLLGPAHNKQVPFVGTPPPTFRFPIWSNHFVPLSEGSAPYYPTLSEEDTTAEYRKVHTLRNGLAIYEYVEPTETVEVAVKVTVPKRLGHRERAHITSLIESAVDEVPNVDARLHYTGPVR